MTISEAADRYGLARKTLLTQIRRGKLAATKSGHVFLVTSAAMEAYIAQYRGRQGFASPTHPYHGQRPPRKGAEDAEGRGDGG